MVGLRSRNRNEGKDVRTILKNFRVRRADIH